MTFQAIAPHALKRRLDDGSAVLVDLREPDEYAREHIPGARLVPLSSFNAHDFDGDRDRAIVFHCKSGNRTALNAERILGRNFRESYALAGGIDAWKAAGLPTRIDRSAPIDVQRQVQIGAGLMVLSGIALGLAVSPWFFALSAFVGGGLTVAGVTGFCGFARLLKLMPWNRRSLALAD
jgi:rhodanese-related sulfurtransferase